MVCARTIPPSDFGRPQLEQPPYSLELQPAPALFPNRPGPLHVRWPLRAGELLEHEGSKRTAGGGLFCLSGPPPAG